ncbi:SoxR reducing system RseC family protein [Pseudomonas abyssi]|uniref:Transcriptional regulator n=1 Tax=Pseudomonas abyssi TaxID=170540 RepID=A0A395R301_9PSED|nr:SoxR reducing system RseC family protein [Halopseudomonas gallaeciensis]RGP54494.1 transcriptional regulator [Halopseudomonas gallaeciensis]
MIEERGRVLSVEPGAVWVETVRSSTCGNCAAKAGCGQGLLQRLGSGAARGFVRALTDRQWQVGDEVIIGVPEDALVRGALWVYLMPLFALFVAALSAQALGAGEPQVILAALAGLAFGFVLLRWRAVRASHDPLLTPQVLGAAGFTGVPLTQL